MKKFRWLLSSLRTLIALSAALTFIIAIVLPPVFGLLSREFVITQLDNLQLPQFGVDSVTVSASTAGWFSSTIDVNAHGQLFSDSATPASRSARLSIYHGPVIWHWSQASLAVADIQLLPPTTRDPGHHQSASATLHFGLASGLTMRLKLIAGLQTGDVEHWIELQSESPVLLPWQSADAQAVSARLWLDLDARAFRGARALAADPSAADPSALQPISVRESHGRLLLLYEI